MTVSRQRATAIERDYRYRRSLVQKSATDGVAAALRGQDEREVIAHLLDADHEAAILLTNPEFMRMALSRVLMRQVADTKLRASDHRAATGMLIDLLGLNKASKVAEVERQVKEVIERLKGEPDTVEVQKSMGSAKEVSRGDPRQQRGAEEKESRLAGDNPTG